ncbi:NUDIX hydrolase [Clostridium thermarum]|uniref:NUDIX hydrolase n=1 Tax=Clostridium thermarum TaxID=1716543 RepID=UPI0013D4D830|nr:CoA pyrophosphatase [Clostridium thermarum]
MKSKDIINIFKDRKGKSIRRFKKSSVVIPILEKDGETYILFEKRALSLRSQPGDICFPGGKLEQGEEYRQAAARELKEELGLEDKDFNIVGEMDYFISPYGNMLYPFVAELYKEPNNYNTDEVDHIFYVPLEFFLKNEPECYIMKVGPHLDENFPFHMIRGGRDYKFTTDNLNQYFYKYKDYVIWGFTALIMKVFTDILKNEGEDK